MLGLVVTEHIHARFPDFAEGDLAKLRASLVKATTLAELAIAIDLGAYLHLGRGEESSGGREKPSILADALEAVIGAVYVDGGFAPAARLVLELLDDRVLSSTLGDAKTRLQEHAAQSGSTPVRYDVEESGPDHSKRFRAEAVLDGTLVGVGEGRSKKQAEQEAAAAASRVLGLDDATTY